MPSLQLKCASVLAEKTWDFDLLPRLENYPFDLLNEMIAIWSLRWLRLEHDFLQRFLNISSVFFFIDQKYPGNVFQSKNKFDGVIISMKHVRSLHIPGKFHVRSYMSSNPISNDDICCHFMTTSNSWSRKHGISMSCPCPRLFELETKSQWMML